jgi:rare lipoprotein A
VSGTKTGAAVSSKGNAAREERDAQPQAPGARPTLLPFLEGFFLALFSLVVLSSTSCSSSRPAAAPAADEPRSAGETQRGLASWYGAEFANLPTASGEIFRPEKVSAAHRTLPLGTLVDVTNEKNGRTVRVKINDRGPFIAGRIVDLSKAAAAEVGAVVDGVVPVTLTVVTLGNNARIRPGSEDIVLTGPATPPGMAFAVQAGAFGNEENAIRLRDRLAARYPNPFIEEFQGLKRVKFGPYKTREEAETARDSLGDLGLAGIVVAYR